MVKFTTNQTNHHELVIRNLSVVRVGLCLFVVNFFKNCNNANIAGDKK